MGNHRAGTIAERARAYQRGIPREEVSIWHHGTRYGTTATIVAVLSGIVTVTPRVAGAATTTVTAGQSATIDAAGVVTAGAAGPIDDTGLRDDAGIGGGRDKEQQSSPSPQSPNPRGCVHASQRQTSDSGRQQALVWRDRAEGGGPTGP